MHDGWSPAFWVAPLGVALGWCLWELVKLAYEKLSSVLHPPAVRVKGSTENGFDVWIHGKYQGWCSNLNVVMDMISVVMERKEKYPND